MDTVSKTITGLNDIGNIKIHGLKIGRLAIKKSAMQSNRPGLLSTLFSFKDKEFGEWLPVWAWVVEHPEGIFLIDTGLTSEVNEEGYFNSLDFVSRYYFNSQMIFEINREEELDYALKQINLDTSSISKVILTHLHLDHTGGFRHLSDTPVLVNELEWQTKDGSFPKLFPSDINIHTVKLESKFGLFDNCHYLTQNKDLVMIHTPGHTRGHVSIALLDHENKIYLFGGDVAYTKQRLKDRLFSATINNYSDNKMSCEKILELAKTNKLIILPSHDADNAQRLRG